MATRLFGSQTSLREANRANLLASIHKFGAMTQVELAEVTGLSTATVSHGDDLLSELHLFSFIFEGMANPPWSPEPGNNLRFIS